MVVCLLFLPRAIPSYSNAILALGHAQSNLHLLGGANLYSAVPLIPYFLKMRSSSCFGVIFLMYVAYHAYRFLAFFFLWNIQSHLATLNCVILSSCSKTLRLSFVCVVVYTKYR